MKTAIVKTLTVVTAAIMLAAAVREAGAVHVVERVV